jgi:uncharacterized protein (TIGR02145 family)
MRAFLILSASALISLYCCVSREKSKSSAEGPVVIKPLRDIDGNAYDTVKIGKQVWMKENLKVTHYRNGDPIPNITDSAGWVSAKAGAYCNYNNDTASDPRGICPAGWKVPSDTDFAYLDRMFGGTNLSGAHLKEDGLAHWHSPNPQATNSSRFTGLPGGQRDKSFERLGRYAFFWNRYEYTGEACVEKQACATECSLCFETSYFNQDWGLKHRGMSVRCIREDSGRNE